MLNCAVSNQFDVELRESDGCASRRVNYQQGCRLALGLTVLFLNTLNGFPT